MAPHERVAIDRAREYIAQGTLAKLVEDPKGWGGEDADIACKEGLERWTGLRCVKWERPTTSIVDDLGSTPMGAAAQRTASDNQLMRPLGQLTHESLCSSWAVKEKQVATPPIKLSRVLGTAV
jgi:hypothetical protein